MGCTMSRARTAGGGQFDTACKKSGIVPPGTYRFVAVSDCIR